MSTLEEKIAHLQQVNANLVTANNDLTAEVTGKMGLINEKIQEQQDKHNQFMSEANLLYLSPLVHVNKRVVATENMDVYQEIKGAFDAGCKLVQLFIPKNTTCYLDTHLSIIHGFGLWITGESNVSSRLVCRRYEPYQTDNNGICHHISPMTVLPGALIFTDKVQIEQQVLEGKRSAPYQHGLFRISHYERAHGNSTIYLSDTKFKTFDSVVYFEGVTSSPTNLTMMDCQLEKTEYPGWFKENNCGWIGLRGWSYRGSVASIIKRNCSNIVNSNVASTAKIVDFIDCWSDGGKDLTESVVARQYDGNTFMGVIA